jgi:hypothetical protein
LLTQLRLLALARGLWLLALARSLSRRRWPGFGLATRLAPVSSISRFGTPLASLTLAATTAIHMATVTAPAAIPMATVTAPATRLAPGGVLPLSRFRRGHECRRREDDHGRDNN